MFLLVSFLLVSSVLGIFGTWYLWYLVPLTLGVFSTWYLWYLVSLYLVSLHLVSLYLVSLYLVSLILGIFDTWYLCTWYLWYLVPLYLISLILGIFTLGTFILGISVLGIFDTWYLYTWYLWYLVSLYLAVQACVDLAVCTYARVLQKLHEKRIASPANAVDSQYYKVMEACVAFRARPGTAPYISPGAPCDRVHPPTLPACQSDKTDGVPLTLTLTQPSSLTSPTHSCVATHKLESTT